MAISAAKIQQRLAFGSCDNLGDPTNDDHVIAALMGGVQVTFKGRGTIIDQRRTVRARRPHAFGDQALAGTREVAGQGLLILGQHANGELPGSDDHL